MCGSWCATYGGRDKKTDHAAIEPVAPFSSSAPPAAPRTSGAGRSAGPPEGKQCDTGRLTGEEKPEKQQEEKKCLEAERKDIYDEHGNYRFTRGCTVFDEQGRLLLLLLREGVEDVECRAL